MKNLFTLLIFVNLCNTVLSQDYIPMVDEGKTWTVGSHGMGLICDFSDNPEMYFFMGDTTFNSVTYKKVYAYSSISMGGNGNNPPFCPPFMIDDQYQLTDIYIREDVATQKVYRYYPDNTIPEVLLFDFSLNIGDSLNGYAIDTIYTITTSDGVERRYFGLEYYVYMIEGIGGNQGPFTQPDIQFEGYDMLMCVKQGALEIYGDMCNMLNTQSAWAPEGAVWHYTYWGGWGNYVSYMRMTSIGDTIIDGRNCSILNLVGPGDSIPYYNALYYTYQSNDTVFLYDGTQFRVLYNFNVVPGDSFETYTPHDIGLCWGEDPTTLVVVDSVGYELVNGMNLKYLVVHTPEDDWGFQNCDAFMESYKIYQTIGSLGYMFAEKICGADGDAVCALRCYEDPQFGFFTTNVADSCTHQVGVGIEDIAFSDVVKVYPNPVSDYFRIELKHPANHAEMLIYSLDGRLVKEMKLNDYSTSIDFTQAKKGCYLLKINLDGKIIQGRIIK